MSRRRELAHHLHQLNDIRNILNAMKNLAFMETRKLARFLDTQHQVVRQIETVGEDFLAFHPHTVLQAYSDRTVYLLIGSERGFCGDFNEALLQRLALEQRSATVSGFIVIGNKLCSRVENDSLVAARIDGPNIAEEVPDVLNRLVDTISDLQARHSSLNLTALYHDAEQNRVGKRQLLPPFRDAIQQSPRYHHPPVLTLSPETFLAELIDHYLFAALHELVYTSLMAENRRRLRHMEGAVQHIDHSAAALKRHYHTLRQEEITEEIEVILLNAESPDQIPTGKKKRNGAGGTAEMGDTSRCGTRGGNN